jgi:ferric-dicitrate binding protein FerR (iron transport regulator)
VTPERRRARRQLAALVTVLLLLNAAVLLFGARALAQVRGDLCTYTASQRQVTLELPQVHARITAEHNDDVLLRQLGC